MKIREIAFVGYPITDVPRARHFYEKVLGLKPSLEHISPHGCWIEYDIGTGTLAISNMWPPSGQSGPNMAFEVEDFDEAMTTLTTHEAPQTFGPMETGICRFAVFLDPDGNSFTIHQRKST